MPDRRKRLALVAAIMGSFVAGLDATARQRRPPGDPRGPRGRARGPTVSVQRLPSGARVTNSGWRVARRPVRRTARVLDRRPGFGAASLLCTIAPSIEFLIACRALQGPFGALLTPSALAVIVAAFR